MHEWFRRHARAGPRGERSDRRGLRAVLVGVTGTVVTLAGIAMVALPGPGLATIVAGLAILATEFLWAHHLLRRVRVTTRLAVRRLRSRWRRWRRDERNTRSRRARYRCRDRASQGSRA